MEKKIIKTNAFERLHPKISNCVVIKKPSSMYFNFRKNQRLSEDGVENLSRALIHLKSFTCLYLDFGSFHNKISDISLIKLSRRLPKLNNLTSVNLNIVELMPPCWVQPTTQTFDRGLRELAQALPRLKNLTSLSLNFENNLKSSYKGWGALCKSLGDLKKLTSIYVKLSSTRILDIDLIKLCQSLPQLENLVSMKLIVDRNWELSNLSLLQLSKALCSFPKLRLIALDFESCNKITVEGIKELSSALSNLKQLNHLQLGLNADFFCGGFNDSSLMNLSEALTNLKELESIRLNFYGASDVSDKGYTSLSETLKCLKFLAIIKLNFRNTRVTKSAKLQMKRYFAGQAKLCLY